MDYQNKIGDTLRRLREHYGASQKDIYTMLGLKQATYSNYENNTREPPFSVVAELCRFYQVHIDEFYSHLKDNTPIDLPNGDAINIYYDTTKLDQRLEFIKSDLRRMNDYGQQLVLDLLIVLRNCPPLEKNFPLEDLIEGSSNEETFAFIKKAISKLEGQESEKSKKPFPIIEGIITTGEDNGDDSEV